MGQEDTIQIDPVHILEIVIVSTLTDSSCTLTRGKMTKCTLICELSVFVISRWDILQNVSVFG